MPSGHPVPRRPSLVAMSAAIAFAWAWSLMIGVGLARALFPLPGRPPDPPSLAVRWRVIPYGQAIAYTCPASLEPRTCWRTERTECCVGQESQSMSCLTSQSGHDLIRDVLSR